MVLQDENSNFSKNNDDQETVVLKKTKHGTIFTEKQHAALLKWVAQGLTGRQINHAAANFDPPFKPTESQIDYWRGKYKIDIQSLRRELETKALYEGLALRSNRLDKLYKLATVMEDDLFQHGKLWLSKVKGIGSGNYFERVVEEEFNESELRQLRGVYDDIAREVGGRRAELGLDEAGDTTSGLVSLPAEMLASEFVDVYRDVKASNHMEYLLKGGRGSTKSSFTSLVFIYLLIRNPNIHGLALRQVANTLRDSVYTQLVWAIGVLGLSDLFKCITSPLEITYLPTNQKIYFRGADKPEKIKSIKTVFGNIGIIWFEELDQFHGQESIRKIEQSVLRGGELAWEFKTYNPPQTAANWVNNYALEPKANQLSHHSTYLTVPREWLGKNFLDEAEHLKEINPRAYQHEYLGEVTGTGGLVFENLEFREIPDEEIYGTTDENENVIGGYDNILHGLDFGYFPDPAHYTRCYYDPARLTLYIFDEFRGTKLGNKQLFEILVSRGLRAGRGEGTFADLVICDSAEPKSIADLRSYGMAARGAEKGPDSVRYSIKWLQSLVKIVIDPQRCPHTAIEFQNYEHEMTKEGEYISEYPDRDNHSIDAVRYATNLIWRRRGSQRIVKQD